MKPKKLKEGKVDLNTFQGALFFLLEVLELLLELEPSLGLLLFEVER